MLLRFGPLHGGARTPTNVQTGVEEAAGVEEAVVLYPGDLRELKESPDPL